MKRAIFAVVFLAGCIAPLDRTPLFDISGHKRFAPPPVEIAAPAEGDCTSAVSLEAGDVADCKGVLVPASYLAALQEKVRQAKEDTEPSLVACYGLVDELVSEGEAGWAGCRKELHSCQKAKRQAEGFAAACTAGHVVRTGITIGVAAGTAPKE